jgi:hypothetical protein
MNKLKESRLPNRAGYGRISIHNILNGTGGRSGRRTCNIIIQDTRLLRILGNSKE